MTSLSGHGFPLARRTGADVDLHPELVAGARRTDPAETFREITRAISTGALPAAYTTRIPPAGTVGIGTVELFLGDDRHGVDVWACWLGATVRTRRTAGGGFEHRAVADGWLGWRRVEVWAAVSPSALTDADLEELAEQQRSHDRCQLAEGELRAAVAKLAADDQAVVHAALDAPAVLARDAAYPHRTAGGTR
jgi:hypothetical protein